VIDAVLFDWGGTLTRFHDLDLLEMWAAAARVISPDASDRLADALLAAEDAAWRRTAAGAESFTTEDVIRAACGSVDLPDPMDLLERAAAAYRDEWAGILVARPEAAEVLAGLRGLNLRTGMLSNTHWPREWHEAALAEDGLLPLLDARIYTSDLTHMKPHPAAFAALLDAVGTSPDTAVFVGDRLHDDVAGA
jgi:putative hydrolase of the HAD superfamily